MFKIAVLDYRFHPDAQKRIQPYSLNNISFPKERCPEGELIKRTGDADIALVTVWDKIDKEYLDACQNLKYIGVVGTSTANLDLVELEKRGIIYSNIPSHSKEHVAEYFFMELTRLMRGVGEYQWKPGEEHELVGKHIGIIGLGQVGKAMADLALAYKMKVSYSSPHRKEEWEDRGLTYLSIDELLHTCDIIAICTPPNVKVFDKSKFDLIRPGSILLQISFGSPFSQSGFKDWISGEGNFAIFDLSSGESNYLAYKDLPRVIFSTKVAGDTYESNARRNNRAIKNLEKFINPNQNNN